MNTILLESPGQFRFVQTAPPADLPAGHALVRVHRVGICGTDWHAFHGRNPFLAYPRVLGHELGVTIERVNDSASDLKPGDRCSVEPYLTCGHCIACRRGKTNCCATLQCLGVHTDGGMRELIVLPTSKLHRSTRLNLDQLALVETLSIGCHAVQRAGVESGENVLILGAGPIGLSIIPFARAAGARIFVGDISPARLEFCQSRMGITETLDASQDLFEPLKQLTNNELPTVIFDATGNAASMNGTFNLIAPGGKIVFVGILQGDVTFSDPNLHRREITVLASRNAVAANFARVMELMESGEVDTTPWITHRAACHELVDALPDWTKPNAGLVKAVVEF